MSSTNSFRRTLCPLKPEKVPRCHAYAYLTLLICTTVLIYFYSYPLEINSLNTRIASVDPFLLSSEIDASSKSEVYDGITQLQRHALNIINVTSSSITDSNEVRSNVKTSPFPINSTKMLDTARKYISHAINNTDKKTSNFIPYITESPNKLPLDKKLSSQKYINIVSFKTGVLQAEISTTKSKIPFSSKKYFRTKESTVVPHVIKTVSNKGVTKNVRFETEFQKEGIISTESRMIPETIQRIEITEPSFKESIPSQVNKTFEKDDISSKKSETTVEIPEKHKTSELGREVTNPRNVTHGNSSADASYLVYSKSCKIPDIDPMHPSILEFVEISPPLSCEDEVPLTYTEGNTLFVNLAEIEKLHVEEFVCCYRAYRRDLSKNNDNAIEFTRCRQFSDKVQITDEFIQVKCSDRNGTDFYEEYYSFIHDKPKVEERCEQHNETSYSVLIIGIDAMSRMNMHRQLNKTIRYLLEEMQAIEMFGFNKVGDNTFPNLIPLLVGYDMRELPQVCYNLTKNAPLDDCNFMWKRYANKGYRTLYAEDSPKMSSFNYFKAGFHVPPTDYYFRPFISVAENEVGKNKELNCYACVGAVSETEAVLSWTEKFASNFKDRPYFAFSWINSLTHDDLNTGSSADHMYEKFFRSLHQSGALNRTIVIVMGDHGMRWGPIRKTYIGRLEERLPILLIALPEGFKDEFSKETSTLKINSHRLITPFDIHATLDNIIHLNEEWSFTNPDNVSQELAHNFTKRAGSLFQPVPEDRSCSDASIDEHWCTCESSLPINHDHAHVKKAAKFLVDELNSLLKSVRNVCARLKLDSITDARVWSPNSEYAKYSLEDTILTVIIKTLPSEAVFEATVRIPLKAKPELLGAISRLNLYGNQSDCVQDAILKKYCYCSKHRLKG